jgi:hypothetical protein
MKNLFAILLLFLSLPAFNQTGVVRLELDASLNSDIYKLVPLHEQGFLLFYETKDEAGPQSKLWFFTHYDRSFTEVWRANVPVIQGASFQDFFLKDSSLYLFFLNNNKVKQDVENFQLLTIDLAKKISVETKGILPQDSRFIEFFITNKNIVIGLNHKNEQAGIYIINQETNKINEFIVRYPDQNFIEDIAYDPYTGQVTGIISNYISRRQNKLYLLTLSTDAEFVADMELSPVVQGKYLNTARLFIADSATYYLLGTYSNLASKIPGQSEYFGIESAGAFATRITNKQQEFMNYYNFMEFRNLRSGISARDFYRLQKKKGREESEYSVNYELLTHNIQHHDSSLVMMFEAYYPEFRTVSDMSYDYWGRPVTHTYSVFEGYRFFNTILAGFDYEGELIWDNSLEINTSPTTALEKKSACFFDGEPVLLFYNDGSKIAYRISLKNADLEPFTVMDIETSEFGDKITAVGRNYMTHWYGYTFLAYGYHTIRNNMLTDKNERTVFYINKSALE